uniref:Spen paralogue and orthologue SPOC C-terminal domain-containing protein n=2 Tax=Triticum urartu TaxID=4572 RepID=A0A8R7QNP8_TRIUA
MLGPSSSIPHWSSPVLRRSSPVHGGMMSQPVVAPTSEAPDDDMKSVIGSVSPFACTSLGGGVIRLKTATVPVLAFFRSGEKIQDIVWPKTIEIKGRVKWGVFKKFLKDLRHSQNRSIMVISLLLNVESSKNGLEGMKQVAKMLKVNKRIGLATTEDGSYIYVCPGHKDIITVLAKYGFWKGASTIDRNQDSFIGFVVRDRKPLVNTSEGEVSIEKIQEIGGTHMEAQEVIYDNQSYPVHPLHAPVDDGLYFRRPPLVLAEQGSYCLYPPPGLLGHDFHAGHPPIGLSGQGIHPHAPECQGVFHQLPPCARGQGFITHRAPNFTLEYFRPLTDHGNNNGSQHLRPPSGSAPGHLWHRMSCARSGNNLPGFERSEGFSGSSSAYYSRFENGSGSMPPN